MDGILASVMSAETSVKKSVDTSVEKSMTLHTSFFDGLRREAVDLTHAMDFLSNRINDSSPLYFC